jgi:3-oxoacyl-[acyl-carrier protein] reductase
MAFDCPVSGPAPLAGQVALVTGVSRRNGIGFAVAKRLISLGASIMVHHHQAHDLDQAWGGDDLAAVLDELRDHQHRHGDQSTRLNEHPGDLAAAGAPELLVQSTVAGLGRIDILVANHARSAPDADLGKLTADILDGHWAVDARSTILLTQAFAHAHHDDQPGRIVFLTSGQHLGPMPGELAYAAAKAALTGITLTLADQLAHRHITLNTVNPGPVDTGYVTGVEHAAIASMFPTGRWGSPDDAARLITWLCTDDASWITGQIINSEGGFARWRAAPHN